LLILYMPFLLRCSHYPPQAAGNAEQMHCSIHLDTHGHSLIMHLLLLTVDLLPAASLFILPESPRWLVVNGHLDMALAVIHRVYIGSVLPAGQLAVSAVMPLCGKTHTARHIIIA